MRSEFNLIEEPWILVRTPDCTVQSVSLRDALIHAHEYEALCGETAAQDAAMLRLLLAVLYTVFARVDESGEDALLETEDDALDRWAALREAGRFPEEPVCDYLEQWKDRFWLFDEKHPFWQTPAASVGTEYGASKLNGEMSESSNKLRLFPARTVETKNALTYAEAARWLLYVNAFDDTSAKPKGKGLPSPGAGWLGKLGIIYAESANLYETLLLNLVFLKNGDSLWDAEDSGKFGCCPGWELEAPRSQERVEIVVPNHYAALMTLQSRRLLLEREEDHVVRYELLGGDFFSRENALSEQMTIWQNRSDEKRGLVLWMTKRHDPARQIWRDFSAIAAGKNSGNRRPGIVEWVGKLREENLLQKAELIRFRISCVQYGDKDFFVTDTISDALSFHVDLLTEAGASWRKIVEQEIESCDRAAGLIALLAERLDKASGGDGKAGDAKALFYSAIDTPFREWLQKLEPTQTQLERDALRDAWEEQVRRIALCFGQELVDASGTAAFIGRNVTEKVKGKDVSRHYSAPEAFGAFKYQINKLYPQEVK